MARSYRTYVLTALRLVLVAGGLLVAGGIVHELATMPPPPPDSDGFAHGMAFIFGSVFFVLALGVAAVGVALPSLMGAEDVLGFNGSQRRLLRGAGALVAGGFLLGVPVGIVTITEAGIVLWLLAILFAVVAVVVALVWRVVEAGVSAVGRVVG